MYAVVAWLLIQIATQVFPFFEIPNWAVRLVVLVLIAGFPVALVFSWAFEITPEGIVRETDVDPGKSITHHTGKKDRRDHDRAGDSRIRVARVSVVWPEISCLSTRCQSGSDRGGYSDSGEEHCRASFRQSERRQE